MKPSRSPNAAPLAVIKMEPGKKKTTETPLKSAKRTIPKTPKSFVQALTSSSPPA